MPGFIRIGDMKGLVGQRSFRHLEEVLRIISLDVVHIHNIHPYVYQVLKYVEKISKVSINGKCKVIIEPHHPAISLSSPLLKTLYVTRSYNMDKEQNQYYK